MKQVWLSGIAMAVALAMTSVAHADVILQNKLSGTGDNVVFDLLNGNLAIGSFNGQHTGLVDFTDLSNNPLFTGSANGNDIKIADTSDLQIVVKDSTNTNVLGTSTQVFSLKGTGDITATVLATDGPFTFDLGMIDPNAQSGFTLTAINGESMSKLTLFDNGGLITDYEHYRIDVAASVPGPIMGSGLPGFAFAVLGMLAMYHRRQRQ